MKAQVRVDYGGHSVGVRKARGPGWVAGEFYDYGTDEKLVRPSYWAKPEDALYAALERLRGLTTSYTPEGCEGAVESALAALVVVVDDYFADTVRTARETKGWSRPELGRQAGVDRRTVWALETGRRDGAAETRRKLLRALLE